MGCGDPANIGWNLGIASAGLVALVVITIIARTPPLREHGNPGTPAPPDKVARGMHWLSLLAIPLWAIGACLCSPAGRGDYAVASALGASIVLAVVLLLLFATAGEQIARRSLR